MPALVTDSVIADIPGWFFRADILLFRFFLSRQVDDGAHGDLAELGAYQGRSAVLIGSYLQSGEIFTVVDLFEDGGDGGRTNNANARENKSSYEGLTRAGFEKNYTAIHGKLPHVIQGLSSRIEEVARPAVHKSVLSRDRKSVV